MANSGASFWRCKEGANASSRADHNRDLAYDHSCNQPGRYATIQAERGDRIGHQFSNRDCRGARARAVLQRMEESGIPASWH
jgi:hypothetical protein